MTAEPPIGGRRGGTVALVALVSARAEVEAILGTEGVVACARYPRLRRTVERMAAEGVLHRVVPGVYCRSPDAAAPEVRIRAAATWAPDAVLTGPAAARLTFWPTARLAEVTLSMPQRPRRLRPGFLVAREAIPPELITEVHGVRVTVPALTALDLGGEAIDRVLRLRLASLDDMAEALNLTAGRAGNAERRRWLLDSRDEPWSEAEREGHRLLRAARIKGWRGNLPVVCGTKLYYLDAGFPRLKLGIEIDGREFHKAENVEQFYTDRRKWTTLGLHGWLLLHFGANDMFDGGDWFLSCVREAMVRRERWAS